MRSVSGLCTPDGPDSTRTWCVCPPEVTEMTGNGQGAESGEIGIGVVNRLVGSNSGDCGVTLNGGSGAALWIVWGNPREWCWGGNDGEALITGSWHTWPQPHGKKWGMA